MAPKEDSAMARDKGSGSIYQDAGGRWRASIEAGWTATGARRRIKVSAATKTAAQTKLKARLRQISESGIPAPGTAVMTVKKYAEQWAPRRAKSRRPKTQSTDESALRKWIIPTIGHVRLDMLSPAHIRSIATAIAKAKRSSSTAHRTQAVLLKMLKDATLDGHMVPPRVLLVEKPVIAPNDRQGLTAVESMAMLTTASGDPDCSRWGAALTEAMRQGECLGLTWQCVDLEAAEVEISWQLQDLPYEHGCEGTCQYKRAGSCPARRFKIPDGYEVRHLDGAWCLVRPKTASGRRVLPLISWMVDTLREWREQCPDSPFDLVWPDENGNPRHPDADRAAWRALQVRAEIAHPAGRSYFPHEA
ncbi:MAG: hypothetical protein ABI382_14135, partial [Nakamurella sp.]